MKFFQTFIVVMIDKRPVILFPPQEIVSENVTYTSILKQNISISEVSLGLLREDLKTVRSSRKGNTLYD